MRQKHSYNYFPFNQSYLTEDKIAWCFCLLRQKKNSLFCIGGQDWIGLMIFKNFANQDLIGFIFIGSALDSD